MNLIKQLDITPEIDIDEILNLKLIESDEFCQKLAKYIGSKYLGFTNLDNSFIDRFWNYAFNNELILITDDIIKNGFGYRTNSMFVIRDFCNRVLKKKFKLGIEYVELDKTNELVLQIENNKVEKRGGSMKKYYALTSETFKTCCMMANTEIGRSTRDYFLKMEKLAQLITKIIANCIKRDLELKIRIKDEKIDNLSRKVDQQIIMINELKEANSVLLTKSDEILNINQNIQVNLDLTQDKLDCVSDKLNIALDQRVKPSNDNLKIEQFLMFDNNTLGLNQFYVIRRQKQFIHMYIKKYLQNNPSSTIFIQIDEQPNSRNLYHRIKEEMKLYINSSGNYLSIKPGTKISKLDFKNMIINIHNERLVV